MTFQSQDFSVLRLLAIFWGFQFRFTENLVSEKVSFQKNCLGFGFRIFGLKNWSRMTRKGQNKSKDKVIIVCCWRQHITVKTLILIPELDQLQSLIYSTFSLTKELGMNIGNNCDAYQTWSLPVMLLNLWVTHVLETFLMWLKVFHPY